MEKQEIINKVKARLNKDDFRAYLEAKHSNQKKACNGTTFKAVTHPLAVFIADGLQGCRVEVSYTCALVWPDKKGKPVKIFFNGELKWAERFVRGLWPHYFRKIPTAYRCLEVLKEI